MTYKLHSLVPCQAVQKKIPQFSNWGIFFGCPGTLELEPNLVGIIGVERGLSRQQPVRLLYRALLEPNQHLLQTTYEKFPKHDLRAEELSDLLLTS